MKIIEKIYAPKVGKKVNIQATLPYTIGKDTGRPFLFNVQIMEIDNTILENRIVNVPSEIMEIWDNDDIITNYVLSQLGLELDLDNTIDLVLEKLNSGTITYASGTQEENDLILQNYATFVALQIESYKRGDIEIDDFPTIEQYNPAVQVTINLGTEAFSVLEFVQSIKAAAPAEKQSKLTDCLTNITQL